LADSWRRFIDWRDFGRTVACLGGFKSHYSSFEMDWIGAGDTVRRFAVGDRAWLWVAFVGLLPWVSRLRMLGRLSKAARGPSRGRHSEVKTRYVAMTLHHDSGDMDGEVLEGEFVGRRLSGLTQEEIVMIWREARRDDQSVKVLEAYLDRTYGESWGDSGTADGSRQTAPGGPMSLEEAYKILGLGPGASEQEIGQRHRDLMKKMHPDHGGSDYLASRINEAKDTLLSQK
jgi:hypothetical protein